MGSRLDLAGRTVSRLQVIKESKTRKHGKVTWHCTCSCGKAVLATTSDLRSGNKKSCGCLQKENAARVGRSNKVAFGHYGLQSLFTQYKNRAKKRGLEFNLSVELFEILTSAPCYYCGKLPSQVKCIEYKYNGLDRVDPLKGYVEGNLLPACKICNYAKLKMSLNDFKSWVKQVYNNLFL